MEIKPADLILVKGTDWISKTIEDVEHSPYSHVAGMVKENVLIEALGFKRTGYQALDYYAGRADVFTCDELTEEQRRLIIEYVKQEVGGHYDYLLLAWEFLRYVFNLLLPYKEGRTLRICSALWADAFRSVGIGLCPGIKYPSPADVAESKFLRKVESLP